ncbi:MAG: protein kinase domain-containing protein [Isosphaeraceae bacterium]
MIVLPRRTDSAALPLFTAHEEQAAGPPLLTERSSVLDELTTAWERGEQPPLEMYLERLGPADHEGAVALIYRHFCLVEAAGGNPDPADYQERFPSYQDALKRLLRLHAECPPSLLDRWFDGNSDRVEMPEVGDSIGPYRLRRELGRGSFARVYLAKQTDLEDRLVVVKVSTRATREPWLLARVRHAHIVEIFSHATADDGAFQLICMPFWGGATLAAVLAAGRERPNRPALGRDLLADLDGVAAPEYPRDDPSRPAREICSSATYGQAVVWIVARLAEALDHAFQRGVAHGDVKPSNILLSADGNPMLLDFNLARDWAAAGPDAKLADPGGTLAYMAPERLRDLAQSDRSRSAAGLGCSPAETHSGPDDQVSREEDRSSEAADPGPQLADIYSLGVVLIEALTGRVPDQVAIPADRASSRRFAPLKSAALAFALARSVRPAIWVRASLASAGYPVSSGLHSILERCLDPDPLARYRRGRELAQDLDRWRTDKPLAFASEPLWSQALPRWVRRRRRLLAALSAALFVGMCTMFVATRWSSRILEKLPLLKYELYLDDPADYRFRRPSVAVRHDPKYPAPPYQIPEPNDPHEIPTAVRALRDYGVFTSREWRLRDDVRLLPTADREDLELWLLEQAYRYCRALIDQTGSRADRDRALMILDHAGGSFATPAFTGLRLRLQTKLESLTFTPIAGTSDSGSQTSRSSPAAAWLDEYLLGVAAEYDRKPEAAATEALDHYDNMLEYRPRSYWGHYRAAAMCFRLGRNTEAESHLRHCLKRRPENAALRGQLAACLSLINQPDEAMHECDLALEGAPELAGLFQNRAFIRAISGKTEGIAEDIEHFELLSHILPRAFWGRRNLTARNPSDEHSLPVLNLPGSPGFGAQPAGRIAELEPEPGIADVDADELNARLTIAQQIRAAGDIELAMAEFTKALLIDPDHLAARMERSLLAIDLGRFDDARRDLDRVLAHPGLKAYLAERPNFLTCFNSASSKYLNQGKVDAGTALARRTLDLAITAKLPRGPCHYILARAYAMNSSSKPLLIDEAAKQLRNAFIATADYYKPLYATDTAFDPVRMKIDLYFALKSESTTSVRAGAGR